MSEYQTEAEALTSFIDAMKDAGITTADPIEADGKLHRIQVDGDPKGKRNGWYTLWIDQNPFGLFGCNKRHGDAKLRWTGKGSAPMTAEERKRYAEDRDRRRAERDAAEAKRQAEGAKLANALWDAAAPAEAHPYLTRKSVESYGLRVGPWLKGRLDGSTYKVAEGALLVPVRFGKDIVSLQAIFAKDVRIGGEDRGKDFVFGGRKQGCWFPIGAPTTVQGVKVILIGEGYATCAAAHAATGLAVLVAFDAGNLAHVAREIHKRAPDAHIVILADNDRWTVQPVENPGLHYARAAAAAVNGEVVCPEFSMLDGRPTDFDDLHQLDGPEAVAAQIWAVVDPSRLPALPSPPVEEEPPPHTEAPEHGDTDHGAQAEAPAEGGKKRKNKPPAEPHDADGADSRAWFTIRGHDRDHIYVQQHEKRMIIARRDSDWGETALMTLADLAWWERAFPGEKGMNRKMAVNWLIRKAYEAGSFDPMACRGRGAWRDGGQIVCHFGNKLIVDGVEMGLSEVRSNYVYEQGRRLALPAEEPLSAADGKRIIQTAQAFHWTRPASAILLSGWIALAPLCGALRWRPHVWVTGGAGSGKSTILDSFVWPLMNGMEVYAQGNSTEAGIRQTLGTDALPVLFDESEQNDERERLRVQAILALIRQASTESGARTLKGSQSGDPMGFMVRSMFCLSSIQVGMKHQADVERVTLLALRPKRDSVDPGQAWATISGALVDLFADKDLPGRLVRRSLSLLPVTIGNIEVFAAAAAEKFGSQREGDQYGAMLAGAWSLVKSGPASIEDARTMIDRYDWTEYLENTETEESTKALGALLGSLIRTPKGDVSVYELVARAAGRGEDESQDQDGEPVFVGSRKDANALLRRHGMMVKWNGKGEMNASLLVANNSLELEKMMASTPYASDIKGQLLRVPGATRHDPLRFSGTVTRSVGIPLRHVLDGVGPHEEPMPADFGDDIPF